MSAADSAPSLLAPDEPPAFTLERPDGRSSWVLLCDHASAAIPRALSGLGLSETDRQRHIAWDIGIAGVSRYLAAALDATLVLQNWSRLVVDCNRPPQAPDAIAVSSDGTVIPGNIGLEDAAIAQRRRSIFDPYHAAIRALLDQRAAAGRPVRLLMMHSFTPIFGGVARPWQIGVLYGRDARLASILMSQLRRDPELTVGDNQPYDVSDATDYAVPVHGEARALPHVELEIRQDLIESPSAQPDWARSLQATLEACETQIAALDKPRSAR
jgi:predicted N-formylglutamate amidohydrolase